jgi:hypothetical protein
MHQIVAITCFLAVHGLGVSEMGQSQPRVSFNAVRDYFRFSFICAAPGDHLASFEPPPSDDHDSVSSVHHWRSFHVPTAAERQHCKVVWERRLRLSCLDRTIVTRERDAKTPTWDGKKPAFVFDPLCWYFAPDGRPVFEACLWPMVANAIGKSGQADDRRTILEFFIDPESDPMDLWGMQVIIDCWSSQPRQMIQSRPPRP